MKRRLRLRAFPKLLKRKATLAPPPSRYRFNHQFTSTINPTSTALPIKVISSDFIHPARLE